MHKQSKMVTERSLRDALGIAKKFRLPAADFSSFVETFLSGINTPRSLTVYILLKYKEYDQIALLEINPLDYNIPVTFRLRNRVFGIPTGDFQKDFAATSLLRKNQGLKTTFDRRSAALDVFFNAEQQCKETNQRIKNYLIGKQPFRYEYILSGCIRKIDRILGSFDVDRFLDDCRWGPGSTLAVKGSNTSPARKFLEDMDISREAYQLFMPLLQCAYPVWGSTTLSNLRCNGVSRVDTVAKNSKTDRTICVEPGINAWLQAGLGQQIRRRLRQNGYDLNSSKKNEKGALKGSLGNSLATVDFSAASDTISKGVVELLLPPRWYQILNSARSHFYNLDDELILHFHKFSSMGNGFTFELESLLFVTLALSVCEHLGIDDSDVSVFGDDIILPSGALQVYIEVCEFLGFTVNTQKTYSGGYFRESCGSYFFNGVDVKPFFIKETPLGITQTFNVLNGCRLLAHRFNGYRGCQKSLQASWLGLFRSVPRALRFLGPSVAGNAVIHDNVEAAKPTVSKRGWEGFHFPGLVNEAVKTRGDGLGLLLARLSVRSAEMSYGNDIPYRRMTRLSFKRDMFCHIWYDWGEWA